MASIARWSAPSTHVSRMRVAPRIAPGRGQRNLAVEIARLDPEGGVAQAQADVGERGEPAVEPGIKVVPAQANDDARDRPRRPRSCRR